MKARKWAKLSSMLLSILGTGYLFTACLPQPSTARVLKVSPREAVVKDSAADGSASTIKPEMAHSDQIAKVENNPLDISDQTNEQAEKMAKELASRTAEMEEAAKNAPMTTEVSPDKLNSAPDTQANTDANAPKQTGAAATQTIQGYRFAVTINFANYCLQIANQSKEEGVGIAYAGCVNNLSQFFAVQPVTGGYSRLVNANSSLCLTNTGAALTQTKCTAAASASQLFSFPLAVTGGSYIANYNGTCLTLNGICQPHGIFVNTLTVPKQ